MVAADAPTAIVFALSPGHDHDAPHGRALLEELGPMPEGLPMLMDRAYEGNETHPLCGPRSTFHAGPVFLMMAGTISPSRGNRGWTDHDRIGAVLINWFASNTKLNIGLPDL